MATRFIENYIRQLLAEQEQTEEDRFFERRGAREKSLRKHSAWSPTLPDLSKYGFPPEKTAYDALKRRLDEPKPTYSDYEEDIEGIEAAMEPSAGSSVDEITDREDLERWARSLGGGPLRMTLQKKYRDLLAGKGLSGSPVFPAPGSPLLDLETWALKAVPGFGSMAKSLGRSTGFAEFGLRRAQVLSQIELDAYKHSQSAEKEAYDELIAAGGGAEQAGLVGAARSRHDVYDKALSDVEYQEWSGVRKKQ